MAEFLVFIVPELDRVWTSAAEKHFARLVGSGALLDDLWCCVIFQAGSPWLALAEVGVRVDVQEVLSGICV